MIETKNEILDLFEELAQALTNPVNVYLIGGAAMMFYERKDQTKDIDIVLASSEEYTQFLAVLEKKGFAGRLPSREYTPCDLSQILVRDEYRLDVFERTVCKGFSLTPSMQNRAQCVFDDPRLKVLTCSPTDIFLFKTFTERDGDIDDCKSLAREEIDWSSFLEEIHTQIHQAQQPVWITYIGERLDLLKDVVHIPVMKEIDKLRDDYYVSMEN